MRRRMKVHRHATPRHRDTTTQRAPRRTDSLYRKSRQARLIKSIPPRRYRREGKRRKAGGVSSPYRYFSRSATSLRFSFLRRRRRVLRHTPLFTSSYALVPRQVFPSRVTRLNESRSQTAAFPSASYHGFHATYAIRYAAAPPYAPTLLPLASHAGGEDTLRCAVS